MLIHIQLHPGIVRQWAKPATTFNPPFPRVSDLLHGLLHPHCSEPCPYPVLSGLPSPLQPQLLWRGKGRVGGSWGGPSRCRVKVVWVLGVPGASGAPAKLTQYFNKALPSRPMIPSSSFTADSREGCESLTEMRNGVCWDSGLAKKCRTGSRSQASGSWGSGNLLAINMWAMRHLSPRTHCLTKCRTASVYSMSILCPAHCRDDGLLASVTLRERKTLAPRSGL